MDRKIKIPGDLGHRRLQKSREEGAARDFFMLPQLSKWHHSSQLLKPQPRRRPEFLSFFHTQHSTCQPVLPNQPLNVYLCFLSHSCHPREFTISRRGCSNNPLNDLTASVGVHSLKICFIQKIGHAVLLLRTLRWLLLTLRTEFSVLAVPSKALSDLD